MTVDLKKYNKIFLLLLYLIIIVYYANFIGNFFSYKMGTLSSEFGHSDPTLFLSALDNFSSLKVPYKDFYFEYGWFFLLLFSIPYIILGKTFLALTISGFLVLPILGVLTSWVIAKLILKKHILILLFLFFCLIYGSNYNFVSMRHLVAEVGLAFLILYLYSNKTKHLAICGAITGLAILSALEYGISLIITVLFILLINSLTTKKLEIKKLLIFGSFLVLTILPFFSWLSINNALGGFVRFNKGFISNYSNCNPCAKESFPRLSSLTNPSFTKVINTEKFIKDLNMYVVPFYYFVVGIFYITKLYRKRGSTPALVQLSLISYGFITYARTLATPCTGYFAYALIPFFLSVTLLLEQTYICAVKRNKKYLYLMVIVLSSYWLYRSSLYSPLLKQKTSSDDRYYAKAGFDLSTDKIKEYEEISNYIEKNTNTNDFVYVYPWGPYNHLTKRPSPTPILTLVQAQIAGDNYVSMVRNDLEYKKPNVIIINIYNNLSVATYGKSRLDVPEYFSLKDRDGPVFAGSGNAIEKYILENYETVFANKLAIVMSKKTIPTDIASTNRQILCNKVESDTYYLTRDYKNSTSVVFKNPKSWDKLEVTQNLAVNMFEKIFTRFLINYYIINDSGKNSLVINEYLSKRSPEKISINNYGGLIIKEIKIDVNRNTGFLGFIKPKKVEIIEIATCKR